MAPASQKCRFTFPNDVKKAFFIFYGPINILGRAPSISLSKGTISEKQVKWVNASGGLAIMSALIENVPKEAYITADNIFCSTGGNDFYLGVSIQYDDLN